MKFKKIIKGCEARGDADSPYLTRYTLLATRWFQLCIHVFHRSDSPELHDHPWSFWTLPLWRGYDEQVRNESGRIVWQAVRPGRLYFRPATYAHRVVLHSGAAPGQPEKRAISLVLMLRRRREWGFFTAAGWQHFREYFHANGC